MQIGWPELILIAVVLLVTFTAVSRPLSRVLRAFLDGLNSRGDESVPPSYPRHEYTQGEGYARGEQTGYEEAAYRQTSPEKDAEDPYRILNVPNDATMEEIRSAYKKLAQMYHPDKVSGLAPEYQEIADRRMKAINSAYELLKNKRKSV